MAGSSLQSASRFAGYTLAGSGIIIIIGALAVGMLILSIIPIYTPNSSTEGFGEVYTISGLTLKAIYTNVTFNFTGGSVLSLQGLSNLCTSILRAKQIPGFYACVASNFTAYGPTSNLDRNSVLQRREIDDVALYEIGDMRLIFSSTCSNRRALGRWFTSLTSSQNSSCVAQRATFCRTFITTPNSGAFGNQWLPFQTGLTQLVISNTTGSGCSAITIDSLFNVAYFNYPSVYGRYNVSRPWVDAGDCYFESISPIWYLQNLIYGQISSNSSACTSING